MVFPEKKNSDEKHRKKGHNFWLKSGCKLQNFCNLFSHEKIIFKNFTPKFNSTAGIKCNLLPISKA